MTKHDKTSCYIYNYDFVNIMICHSRLAALWLQLCRQSCHLSHSPFCNSSSTCVVSFKSVSTVDPSRDETLISWERSWIQGSLLCLMPPECTEISAHWEPNYPLPPPHPPPPPLVLEHGDFTLLLCKACFSVCVTNTWFSVGRGHWRLTKEMGPCL